jgi:hypothetical protein
MTHRPFVLCSGLFAPHFGVGVSGTVFFGSANSFRSKVAMALRCLAGILDALAKQKWKSRLDRRVDGGVWNI